MSLSFIVVLERRISGLEPRDFDGRRLASLRHALDGIARDMDLRGLGEFVAFSQQEAEALADDMRFDAPTVGGETGRWFRAGDGLEVVRAIREFLRENPEELDEIEEVAAALSSMETILEAAESERVRFRLSLEY
ncbi:MAG: hypothetical protein ACRD3V_02855 [Vicinamibacteria bacterium]